MNPHSAAARVCWSLKRLLFREARNPASGVKRKRRNVATIDIALEFSN